MGVGGPPSAGHTKTQLWAPAGGRPGGLPISAQTPRCGDPRGGAPGVLKRDPWAWQLGPRGSNFGSVTSWLWLKSRSEPLSTL